MKRCFGNGPGKEFYAEYHDKEWGIPNHDDRHLFEMIVLEGAQAGLSWETVLKKRDEYRKVFHNFDPKKVAAFTDDELEKILLNPGIIRNRRKVFSARDNARAFLEIQKEFGSFDRYVWGFVQNRSIKNHWKEFKELPCRSEESDALSKDLKKRGMNFVGTKIIYSFMQAVGMVIDHPKDCWRYQP
ncbi:MAG: DNA-3-methyladenine glycosylase I [Verrucomicrobia bacterium]|nr:DNA-3-methyladenine glycosylase I [Verrucomicrobiota bacterium]